VEKYTPVSTYGARCTTTTKTVSYKFVIDTIGKKITRYSAAGSGVYTIDSIASIKYNNNGYSRKFYITQAGRFKGSCWLRINNKQASLSFEMFATLGGKQRSMGEYRYEAELNSSTIHAKYLSTTFHEINEETPLEEHLCDITVADQVVLIGDLQGTAETCMLNIVSVDEPIETATGTIRVYTCSVLNRPDEKKIVKITTPSDLDYPTVVQLTHTVYDKPVYTKNYLTESYK
jgi:hypothetical protein